MPEKIDAPMSPLRAQVQLTRRAARELAQLSAAQRNQILLNAAQQLELRSSEILEANQRDVTDLDRDVAEGKASASLAKRLKTSPAGIKEMADRVRDVAALPDPLAHPLAVTELDDHLVLEKVPCPLGVVGVVFESRPDAVPQVGSLAIKTANGLVLKGGAEARNTNRVLVSIWRDALAKHNPALTNAICALEEREEVMQVLQMDREIDLIVPRGSTEFVNFVFRNSRVPVLGHGSGICHIYVDAAADQALATGVIIDAKIQYAAACNAVEKVLVHQDIAGRYLPALVEALVKAGVEVRGCGKTLALCSGLPVLAATEEDWRTEYGDLKITIKVVANAQDAMDHIDIYGSRHTECIITEDNAAAELFMNAVDAASVFHNASTRFADGFRYGLGAEIGISNSKLHARGPVGLEGLLTYKYKLRGTGQVVSTYAAGKRTFTHRSIPPETK
jgi:glutamate-5-semialdehyde dehydrogenase